MRRLAEVWIEGQKRVMQMTKRRKADALCQQDANDDEMPPPKTTRQSAAMDEELECRLRSALADVYEVLGYASDERNGVECSNLELVNELIH